MEKIVAENVSATLFLDPTYREIFQFGLDYFQRSGFKQCVTRDLLEDEFKQFFLKHEWPEEDYLVDVLISRLRDKFRRIQLQSALRDIGAKVMDDTEDALLEGLDRFSRLQLDTTSQDRTFVFGQDFEKMLDVYFSRVLEKNESYDEKRHRGVYLLDDTIDDFTYGIRKSELAVLVAAPNVGKSWVVAKAALEAALRGYRVYYASLENRDELTRGRLECLLSGVPYSAYERGELTLGQVEDLKNSKGKLEQLSDNLIVDCPKYRKERTTYELYTRARFHGADLFVGDQLSWITSTGKVGDKTQETSDNIADIADVTREMDMASLWAVQFNRQAGMAKKGRGGLHHIALSSAIEQTVDWAFSLSRTKEMTDNSVSLFEILKSRRTDYKMWLLEWSLRKETKIKVAREYLEAD